MIAAVNKRWGGGGWAKIIFSAVKNHQPHCAGKGVSNEVMHWSNAQ